MRLLYLATALSLGLSAIGWTDEPKSQGEAALPAVQMFVPGFEAQLLPVTLTNLVHIEYAQDGRLFAAGYDSRMHLLSDTDGDGLEDQVTTFWNESSADYPLGMTVHNGAVYVLYKLELVRFVDTDQDGVPDKRETVLKDWDDPQTAKNPLFLTRRVDYGMGLAIGADESIYIGMGNAAYNNGYLLDKDGKLGEKGKNHYSPHYLRGCVLKFSPDGKRKEQILTGVRYLMSMQFNRQGDLFATDQEGATWLPNGNPFDELLHLQPGRHYGFPPRHPQYLPNVIDEPSVFDYAPQHQSLCGFRFNEPRLEGAIFGPPLWRDDAFLAGFTRGKLYRTKLVKTEAGYVAQNQLLGALQSLAADLSMSPLGDLVIASHTGKPDWGTGPKGNGILHKIRYRHRDEPLPVAAWSAGPGEFRIAFHSPLDPLQLKLLAKNIRVEAGRNVFAGDRFETIRPGYEVVKRQIAETRHEVPVLSAGLSSDQRTLLIQTMPNSSAWNYALTVTGLNKAKSAAKTVAMQPAVDLLTDLNGVAARWKSADGEGTWSGWLPHVESTVTSEMTQGSAEHERLALLLKQPGTLTLRGQLDLYQMLHPAIQPISKLDYERPVEKVSIVITASRPFHLKWATAEFVSQPHEQAHRIVVQTDGIENRWPSFELSVPTGDTSLHLHWFTADDARPRAFPLRRFLLPWAKPIGATPAPIDRAKLPELAGGDRERGQKVFLGDVANCSKCHSVRGAGAKLAPDLSNLIHRDYDSVLRDIREPSAAINPDYLAYTVVTKDGRSLSGTIQQETKTSVTLADNTGKLIEVRRADIDELKPSPVSIMPLGVADRLSPEQLRDLLTFLLVEPN